MRRPSLPSLLVLSVLTLGPVAACGSDDDSSVPTDATTGVESPAAVQNVAPEEGATLIEQLGDTLTVIDVRTPVEFSEGHLDGALNLDVEGGTFSAEIAALPKDAPYMVYCRSGRRSSLAAHTMVDAGFTDVYDLGAITDWIGAGLPVVSG